MGTICPTVGSPLRSRSPFHLINAPFENPLALLSVGVPFLLDPVELAPVQLSVSERIGYRTYLILVRYIQ